MTPGEWKELLARVSRDILADEESAEELPPEVVSSGWLGFPPATEAEIAAAETRLGKRLPPSLRSFYTVSNGWRIVGCFIYDILPVQELGWLRERDPDLYHIAEMTEAGTLAGAFSDSPGGAPGDDYAFEEGTRVKRSLAVTSDGDASTWLLDPETRGADGEWSGGRWSSWNPGMGWYASSFAELVKEEHATFLSLRQ